jgi:hypothetical protein
MLNTIGAFLSATNSDSVQYTGDNVVPTLPPNKGEDTVVLLNGDRYDWNGTVWILIPTPVLTVTKLPLYEYRDIWAEENATLANNSTEWSFGAGAEGYIGLPIDSGWEVIAMYFHSDNNGAADDLTINLIDIATNPSGTAPTIATLTMVNSGSGQANNAWGFQDMLSSPVSVPANAVLGFRTGTEVGNIGNARVGARLRRQISEYVSDVQLI